MISFGKKIPIVIHPFFWLVAGLIGWINSQTFLGTIIWIAIILISVLIHELGHAIMALIFKKKPVIQLVPMGGVTSYQGEGLKFYQQFLITLFGPIFGFLLFLSAYLILKAGVFHNPVIISVISVVKWVNLFWTIVNLLPIIPLDGGQLLRIGLEAFFGVKGFRAALLIGIAVSLGIALFCFVIHFYLIGAIFFFFTFQSFDYYRKSKYLTKSDRKEEFTQEIQAGEMALQEGNFAKAREIFNDIRNRAEKGILHAAATHYLAMLDFQEGKTHEAYELLLSVKDQLNNNEIVFLQKLAFEEKNYQLVAELSAKCFQLHPTKEVALRNARAFGVLSEAKSAGGWLQRAVDYDHLDINQIVSEGFFDNVRENPIFKKFIL